MTKLVDVPIIVNFQSLYYENGNWGNEDDINIYINIEDPDEDIKKQRFPDEIVIPMNKIQIQYTYPLSNFEIIEYETKNELGFTRTELAKKVCEGYQKIYNHEISARHDPAREDEDDSPYGIWGHCIGDLMLYEVNQREGNIFGLGVDS
jgi:hypothetical protein